MAVAFAGGVSLPLCHFATLPLFTYPTRPGLALPDTTPHRYTRSQRALAADLTSSGRTRERPPPPRTPATRPLGRTPNPLRNPAGPPAPRAERFPRGPT